MYDNLRSIVSLVENKITEMDEKLVQHELKNSGVHDAGPYTILKGDLLEE
jgi:hypothetical protein